MRYQEIVVGAYLHRGEQALRDAVLRRPFGRPSSAEAIDRDRTGRHFVALDGGEVVGCVGLYPEGEGVARVRHLAVAPERQGEGIGAGLMRFGETCMRQDGAAMLVTDARVTAQRFYVRCGFTAEGEHYLENAIPHVFMRKRI